jgi:hypothetical protein
MLRWSIAIAVALLIALGPLVVPGASRAVRRRALGAALLRALGLALVLALLLDAPAGRARPPRPFAAVDVSRSTARARGEGALRDALAWARASGADSVFLFGDSLRPVPGGGASSATDDASRARPAVEQALAAGRALLVATDGELDDPDALRVLPAGSEVRLSPASTAPDLALAALTLPRAAVSGDTVDIEVTVVAGPAGARAGSLDVMLGDAAAGRVALEPLAAHATRTVTVRTRAPHGSGTVIVRAAARGDGDAEPANDTLRAALELSAAASAVFVSSAPDEDARFVVALLRGALSLPTRGFYRIAPGQWRREGTLEPATEAEVRAALRDAPLAVVHGDTAVLGAPRALVRGSLALVAPPPPGADEGAAAQQEFFATAAPPSPLAPALAGLPWDSLPPLRVADRAPVGAWDALETRRGRRFERRVAIAGSDDPRRVVIVAASGFWRWRFRGGASADAFAAVWGGVFDWLAEERLDPRAAVPTLASVRAGEPVRWRRGASARADSVQLGMTRRAGSMGARGADSTRTLQVTLRWPAGSTITESPALAPGIYDVRAPGGASVLVVNPSRELVPRQPTVRAGKVGTAPRPGEAPGMRTKAWAFVLAAGLLCAEWVLRRRMGMR